MRAQSSPRPGRGEAANNPPASARTFRFLSYKHPAPVRPLECALPRFLTTAHSKQLTGPHKSFRMRTYEKTRGEGPPTHSSFLPPFTRKETRQGSGPSLLLFNKDRVTLVPASVSGACAGILPFSPVNRHGSPVTSAVWRFPARGTDHWPRDISPGLTSVRVQQRERGLRGTARGLRRCGRASARRAVRRGPEFPGRCPSGRRSCK